jgi:uncharacterized RmlC-like cupin family protein
MAIALTTEQGPTCHSDAVPVALREVVEAPDSLREATTASAHETTIHVIDGIVYVLVADENEWVLTPGATATIDAGVPYRRWNAGDEDARWVELYCAR